MFSVWTGGFAPNDCNELTFPVKCPWWRRQISNSKSLTQDSYSPTSTKWNFTPGYVQCGRLYLNLGELLICLRWYYQNVTLSERIVLVEGF